MEDTSNLRHGRISQEPADGVQATGPTGTDHARVVPGRERHQRPSLGRVVLAVALVGVVSSLALRATHRGPYYPGWDVLGAAQGLFLLSTKTPAEILRWYLDHLYDAGIAWNTYGALPVLLPGWLTTLWPWDYWAHCVSLILMLASLYFVGAAVGLEDGDWVILLLGWGASSTLLSWSICGFAYLSGVLPYALALWVVYRCQRRRIATLLLVILTVLLARQVHELGRLVFVVFFAAAAFVRPALWILTVA